MNDPKDMVVTLTVGQLEDIVTNAVARGITKREAPPEYLSRSQVAKLIGVNERTIDAYVATHGLLASKLGNEWRFSMSDVVAWISDNRHKPKKAS
jgi:excisionase family DNA binding protein